MIDGARIFVAGHAGLVGSALVRALEQRAGVEVVTAPRETLDLRDAAQVDAFFARERPELVFLPAGRVGGIRANSTRPVEFLRDNLLIATHVIDAAWRHGVRKLCYFGSSCIYPRMAPQPIAEEALLTGALEATNEWYAIAKIAGVKLCQAYRRQHGFAAIALMPTNLYGPGDNFSADDSHVIPGLLRRFHEAARAHRPSVVVWGSGQPRREFLHVDDLADAALHLMERYDDERPINVGTGWDLSIAQLAEAIARVVGYEGRIEYDRTQPDGTPRKCLDVRRIQALGWRPRISLDEGLERTYRWYQAHEATVRGRDA